MTVPVPIDQTAEHRTVLAASEERVAVPEEGQVSILRWPSKDPAEDLDYVIDWTARLAGDTIATSIWTVRPLDGSIVEYNQSWDQTWSKLWLKGGRAGTTYLAKCVVTTAALRTMEQTVSMTVQEAKAGA